MFEDSTFESTGRIRTRSRRWMIAAFAINGSIVLVLILIPLIDPQALPRVDMPWLIEAPPPPPAAAPNQPVPQPAHAAQGGGNYAPTVILAPTTILDHIGRDSGPALPPGDAVPGSDGPLGTPGGVPNGFPVQHNAPVVVLAQKGPVRLPSTMVEGMLIHKTIPVYPSIGIAIHQEGTVVLQATISKAGTIENLRVLSGPPILRQAAVDAVATWRYRPYLLNDQPVEVETTVNVVFTMGR
ncbi:MAG: energy transducer TonB [Terracidiphilus sp.]|jgi:protein TonB